MPTDARERPDFLWIVLEDTSPRFGCCGDPVARTPNVDGLAADGRPFLGPDAVAREYVCAARDRHGSGGVLEA